MDRQTSTLSGGESQRITLATQIGSSLVGSLYVLDEPSIGLHQRDTARLISVVKRLRDLGNTVVVVEHDKEMMLSADYIIDIGPNAGALGGEVVYSGELTKINDKTKGLTAEYLTGRLKIETPKTRRKWRDYIELKEVRGNNLKKFDVKFPLGVMTVVAGVSGSGKSTLMNNVFMPSLNRITSKEKPYNVGCSSASISNSHLVFLSEYVDQNNIARSSRSNPCIYIGAFDDIRKLYAEQPLAKQMGYKPYFFSFNKEGGRCETCKGDGFTIVEMQFMADINLVCSECLGKRFQRDILEVLYNDKNIYDILEMTVDEAVLFFGKYKDENKSIRNIITALEPLQLVGLGYIKLGQSSSTLSGGENQRLKLANYLKNKNNKIHTVFVFDEPTTGLHFNDIKVLLKAFNLLIERGNTVIIVEHNIDVIKSADWVIELGEEGGENGGYLIAEGTPEDVAHNTNSPTAEFLHNVLSK